MRIEQLSFGADAYPESLFRLYAADPQAVFLLAESEGARHTAIAGYIIVRFDRWGAEIVSLAVDPEFRRRGIGRALLRSAIRQTSRRSARSVRLMVRVDNTSAAKFYRDHGFRSIGRIPDYYEDGAAAIRMRLRFQAPA
jgi:ribosomal-protein-alanine acetyltransferase